MLYVVKMFQTLFFLSSFLSVSTSLILYKCLLSSKTAGLVLAQTAAETAWLQTFTTADLLNQTTIRAALFQAVAKSLSCYNFKKLLQQLCCTPEMLIMRGGDIIHFKVGNPMILMFCIFLWCSFIHLIKVFVVTNVMVWSPWPLYLIYFWYKKGVTLS